VADYCTVNRADRWAGIETGKIPASSMATRINAKTLAAAQ